MRQDEQVQYEIGDYVRSELDGQLYRVLKFGPRNDLDPLPGVNLIGNCVQVVCEKTDHKFVLYEWEVSLGMVKP